MSTPRLISVPAPPLLAVLIIISTTFVACDRTPSPSAQTTNRSASVITAPKSTAPVADLDALPAPGTVKAATPGDDVWKELIGSIQPLEPPAAWETNAPSRDEISAFQK